jgi:DNA-binding GntR family transcriptional regulator
MVETHNALFEHFISVCENERLASTICNLMRPFQRFRVMLSEEGSNMGAVEFYEEIIAAFRERDPQRAAFLAAKYSGDTSVSILRNITSGSPIRKEE